MLGPRTGYADQEARACHETAPPRLAAAAGAWYDESATCPRTSHCVPSRAARWSFRPARPRPAGSRASPPPTRPCRPGTTTRPSAAGPPSPPAPTARAG
ncbi:hypothetical protein ACIBJD_11625 [Kitasatospora sp. NPDC050467]|uniref:hypothetical protein n=1 Tax=Kitasatospora sp. NPDC050467 TaxID=3364053 RepID=UPI0037A1DF04